LNSPNAEVELATNQRAPAFADYLERIRDAAVSRRRRLVDTFSVLTDLRCPGVRQVGALGQDRPTGIAWVAAHAG
jgi:hypothetical protein